MNTIYQLDKEEESIRRHLLIHHEGEPPWVDMMCKLRLTIIALERRVIELERKAAE